jgi:hypothetical protein
MAQATAPILTLPSRTTGDVRGSVAIGGKAEQTRLVHFGNE